MADSYEDKVRALTPAKAIAIGVYGESVASYRYRTLAESTPDQADRNVFAAMAAEEHGHHARLKTLADDHFPGGDFVLTPEDKELIIVGPRMIEITDRKSRDEALAMIYESERLTGRFYAVLHESLADPAITPLMKEMADECFEHAEQIARLRADSPG